MARQLIRPVGKALAGIVLLVLAALLWLRLTQISAPDSAPLSTSFAFQETSLKRKLVLALGTEGNRASGAGQNLEARLLKAAPLSTLPVLSDMSGKAEAGDIDAVEARAGHVLDIDPRNEAAKLQLAEVSVIKGDFDGALQQISSVIAHAPQGKEAYLTIIARLAEDPRSWPAIDKILQTRPDWGSRLLPKLEEPISDPKFYARLYNYFPEAQEKYIAALARRGQWDDAFIAFISSQDTDRMAELTVPLDRNFKGVTAPKPFNWAINSQFAAIEPEGLFVFFFGRGNPTIVEQATYLSPGTYRFSSNIGGESYRGGGSLKWIVSCAQDDQIIGATDIRTLTATQQPLSFDFTIPATASCAYQKIALTGVAGEFSRTTRAQIEFVAIDPVREAIQ